MAAWSSLLDVWPPVGLWASWGVRGKHVWPLRLEGVGAAMGGGGGGWSPVSSLAPPKCDMQKLTVDELKRLLYDTFCEHLSMKDIENIIMTEEESHLGTAEECPVDVESEWPRSLWGDRSCVPRG